MTGRKNVVDANMRECMITAIRFIIVTMLTELTIWGSWVLRIYRRQALSGVRGEPVSMENDFTIEKMLDMHTESEVQNEPTLINIDCVGQDELYK